MKTCVVKLDDEIIKDIEAIKKTFGTKSNNTTIALALRLTSNKAKEQ